MQARRQHQELTVKTSLQLVKTMLQAGFGCIARLRELFPEDNFCDPNLSAQKMSSSGAAMSDSQTFKSQMQVKMVKRGHTPEADKLLDYLEVGIFDALERRYLKSFIFAIYIDKDHPTNIIEAYTFNFSYVPIPGTDLTVPVLSLEDHLGQMSLGGAGIGQEFTKPPTLAEAKQSLRGLISRLMMAVQSFDGLPSHRFATFKLFYTEDTPADYEPPHFEPGNFEKDQFVFKLHSNIEQPDMRSIGGLKAGFHMVDVHLASIASYLPNKENRQDVILGDDHHEGDGELPTPASVRTSRLEERKVLKEDAEMRVVTWNAESFCSAIRRLNSDDDADGEPDPDFGAASSQRASLRPIRSSYEEQESAAPPEAKDTGAGRMVTEILKHQTLGQLGDPTQVISQTQNGLSGSFDSMEMSVDVGNVEVKPAGRPSTSGAVPAAAAVDSNDEHQRLLRTGKESFHNLNKTPSSIASEEVRCFCKIKTADDDCLRCDGPCHKWYHIRCMGFSSLDYVSEDEEFLCLNCRLERDPNFDALRQSNLYDVVMAKFKELCIYRRSLCIVRTIAPPTPMKFRKLLGTEADVSAHMWKRLELEGFIRSVGIPPNNNTQRTRGRPKKPLAKPTFRVVQEAFKTTEFSNYFSPSTPIEYQMIGLSRGNKNNATAKKHQDIKNNNTHNADMQDDISPISSSTSSQALDNPDPIAYSQTQDDLGIATPRRSPRIKRLMSANPNADLDTRPFKKVKISLAKLGVDLEP